MARRKPKFWARIFKQGVVEVALSGNLGFVPLDEVLRLLARSGQTGAVEVRGDDVRGRVFVSTSGISLATIFEDSSLRSHLVNSGYVDEATLSGVESGESGLPANREGDTALVDLIREMTVEGLFQMSRKGATFEVDEDATSPYGSPRPFDLEEILDAARRRQDEWSEVESLVADMHSRILMNRDLGDRDEVTLSREAWMLLSEIGAGSSVAEMAARLGTTEFWTAKVAADMAERQLLILDREETVEQAPAWEPQEAPAPEAPPVAVDEQEDLDPNESWWVEPEPEEGEAQAEVAEERQEAAEPSTRLGRYSPLSHDEEPGDTEELAPLDPDSAFENVEEDTEAFLEKVFSELEETDEDEESETEGHGLLRRRRLGSMLQDHNSDD